MLKGIAQRLLGNPVDLMPDDWMQRPCGSHHVNPKRDPMTCAGIRGEHFTERFDGGCQVLAPPDWRAQSLHGLPPLGNRFLCLIDCVP